MDPINILGKLCTVYNQFSTLVFGLPYFSFPRSSVGMHTTLS